MVEVVPHHFVFLRVLFHKLFQRARRVELFQWGESGLGAVGLQAGALAWGLGAGPLCGVGELVQDVYWLFLLSLLFKQIRIKPPRLLILLRIQSPLPRPRRLRLGMVPSSEHLLHGCHLLLVEQRNLSCGFVLDQSLEVALGLEAWEPFVGGEEEAPS